MENNLLWLFWIGGEFLLGGVMFSQLVPKLLGKGDVGRDSDDHNPGAANVFCLCGVPLGVLCLLLDLLKGFVPVFLAKDLLDPRSLRFAGVIAAPVLGHAAGVFNRFRGGKCIATAFGVLAALLPETWIVCLLAGLYIFFSTLVKVQPMRRRSLLVFTLFGITAFGYLTVTGRLPQALGCGIVGAVAAFRHRKPLPEKSPFQETSAVS